MPSQDDETLQSLTAEDPPSGIRGWFYRLYCRLFVHNFDASISQSESLMYIHTNAEEFDVHAEVCLGSFQVSSTAHCCTASKHVISGMHVACIVHPKHGVSYLSWVAHLPLLLIC